MTAVEAWAAPEEAAAQPAVSGPGSFGPQAVYSGAIAGMAVCGVVWMVPNAVVIVAAGALAVVGAALFGGGRTGGAVAGGSAAALAHAGAVGPLVAALVVEAVMPEPTREGVAVTSVATATTHVAGFLVALAAGGGLGWVINARRSSPAGGRVMLEPAAVALCWGTALSAVVITVSATDLGVSMGGPGGALTALSMALPAIAAFGAAVVALWWAIRRRWRLQGAGARLLFVACAGLGLLASLVATPMVVLGGLRYLLPALCALPIGALAILAPVASYRAARKPLPAVSISEAFAGGVLAALSLTAMVWGVGGAGFGMTSTFQMIPLILASGGQPLETTPEAAMIEQLSYTTTWVPWSFGIGLATWVPIALVMGFLDRWRRE